MMEVTGQPCCKPKMALLVYSPKERVVGVEIPKPAKE